MYSIAFLLVLRPSLAGELGVVMAEVAGQVAVGVGLLEEQLGPVLEGGDRVGAGGEAQRRLVLGGEVDQRVGELGGIAALLAVHALPGATVCSVRSA